MLFRLLLTFTLLSSVNLFAQPSKISCETRKASGGEYAPATSEPSPFMDAKAYKGCYSSLIIERWSNNGAVGYGNVLTLYSIEGAFCFYNFNGFAEYRCSRDKRYLVSGT